MNQQTLPELSLRDIHLPDAVLWWPLALGWWLIIALLLIFALGIGSFYYRKQKNTIEQQAIVCALDTLVPLYLEDDQGIIVTHISQLLRRVCISLYGRKQVAGLTGERWLRFLDRKGRTTAFTQGVGRILVDYPYRQEVRYPQQELLVLVQSWLKQQKRNSHV